jgi:hypothetical protein
VCRAAAEMSELLHVSIGNAGRPALDS